MTAKVAVAAGPGGDVFAADDWHGKAFCMPSGGDAASGAASIVLEHSFADGLSVDLGGDDGGDGGDDGGDPAAVALGAGTTAKLRGSGSLDASPSEWRWELSLTGSVASPGWRVIPDILTVSEGSVSVKLVKASGGGVERMSIAGHVDAKAELLNADDAPDFGGGAEGYAVLKASLDFVGGGGVSGDEESGKSFSVTNAKIDASWYLGFGTTTDATHVILEGSATFNHPCGGGGDATTTTMTPHVTSTATLDARISELKVSGATMKANFFCGVTGTERAAVQAWGSIPGKMKLAGGISLEDVQITIDGKERLSLVGDFPFIR